MEFLETVWDFWMNWTSSLDWIKSTDVFSHIYFSLLKMGLIFIVNRLWFSFVRIPLLKLLAFHWLCMIFLWFFNDRWYAYKTDEIDRTNAHEISYNWIQNWMVRYVFVINISNIFIFIHDKNFTMNWSYKAVLNLEKFAFWWERDKGKFPLITLKKQLKLEIAEFVNI